MKTTRTKIIATLGPASNSPAIILGMMLVGMDVARLNFSHGNRKEHRARLDIVRELSKKINRRVRVLQDLQGNRIRIGSLRGHKPVLLRKDQTLMLTREDIPAEPGSVPFDYTGPLKDIKAGRHIFIDDGKIDLVVRRSGGKALETRVAIGGTLNERKGVNIPEARLEFPLMPDKDIADIRFGIENKVDYIAQSFVRGKEDILKGRELVSGELPGCRLIAKIECREAIRNIDEIIRVSDGIMIARGDMGISIPVYQIPIVQKEIIRKCNKAKKFVITATQMLESMVVNHTPTRAEVTDVANAILDGTDLVMLSEETAAGRYPIDSVDMMEQVIRFTEHSRIFREHAS